MIQSHELKLSSSSNIVRLCLLRHKQKLCCTWQTAWRYFFNKSVKSIVREFGSFLIHMLHIYIRHLYKGGITLQSTEDYEAYNLHFLSVHKDLPQGAKHSRKYLGKVRLNLEGKPKQTSIQIRMKADPHSVMLLARSTQLLAHFSFNFHPFDVQTHQKKKKKKKIKKPIHTKQSIVTTL